jgi:hypothetical protein
VHVRHPRRTLDNTSSIEGHSIRTTATHHDIETAHLAGVQPDDPLAADVDYPWDAPVSRTSIPFGVDSEQRPIMLGLLGSGQLLAGRTGSGKSAGLATLLCGIARLENVTLVGFDHSKFELAPWKSRFSRIAGEHESVSVLEAIIEEMDRRYTWLAEHDLKTVAPGQMSPTMPLIVVVIAELPNWSTTDALSRRRSRTSPGPR